MNVPHGATPTVAILATLAVILVIPAIVAIGFTWDHYFQRWMDWQWRRPAHHPVAAWTPEYDDPIHRRAAATGLRVVNLGLSTVVKLIWKVTGRG